MLSTDINYPNYVKIDYFLLEVRHIKRLKIKNLNNSSYVIII